MKCCQPNATCRPVKWIGLRSSSPHISRPRQTRPIISASQVMNPSQCSAVSAELETIVHGMEELATFHALDAARAVLDAEIPGSAALFVKPMAQLLPVCAHPADAALMIKLLSDEGVIGSRSTAGREGPVVGRPVRRSGSRPLLVAEILEHWDDEVKPTCLLRWSRKAGLTQEQLEVQLQAAYQQSQASSQWSIVDAAQVCHGSGGSSSSSSSSRGGSDGSSAWPSRQQSRSLASGQGGSKSSGLVAAATATLAAPALATSTAAAAAAAAAAEAPATPDPAAAEGDAASVMVQPCSPSVVPSMQQSRSPCFVLSTHPLAVTKAALAAVGLTSHCTIICAPTLELCVQLLLQQLMQQERLEQQQLTVILSSPNKAWQLQQQRQHLAAAADNASSVALRLQVAEWACRAPGLKAKTLAAPEVGLLSEVGLAELLGVADSDAVMDGIAWRD